MNKLLEQQLADQRDAAEKKVIELESRIRDLERDLSYTNMKYTGCETALLRYKEQYQDSQQTIKNQREHITQLERRIVEVGAEFINQSYKMIDLEKRTLHSKRA